MTTLGNFWRKFKRSNSELFAKLQKPLKKEEGKERRFFDKRKTRPSDKITKPGSGVGTAGMEGFVHCLALAQCANPERSFYFPEIIP